LGASLSLDSNYLLRGVSLSDGRPALSLAFAYDDPSGAYGDATVVGSDTRPSGVEVLGYVLRAGYAQRLASGMSWDVGLTHTALAAYADQRYSAHYTEIYAGLSRNGLSAHVYLSPRYFDEGVATAYVDVDGSVRPWRSWRLFGHLGLLTPLSTPDPPTSRRPRFDVRLGLARAFRNLELHAAWTATTPSAIYPPGYPQRGTGVDVGVSWFF
jgi:uncharacterized protein (TIGR02001 family)